MVRRYTDTIQVGRGPSAPMEVATKQYVDSIGGGSSGPPAFMIFVAANDAPASQKTLAGATYTCDGTADDVQINAAITAVKAAGGGLVQLSSGTFNLAAPVAITGSGDVDVEEDDIELAGLGTSNTKLNAATGIARGISVTGSAKCTIRDLAILVGGTTHGLDLIAGASLANFRSAWLSTFRNIQVIGPWDTTHTGYAFHLANPFRSVFENLESGGCGNHMRIYSTDNALNPGDCVVIRSFGDLSGNNRRAYSIESTVANGNVNQIEFIMCEAIASGTGCVGIYLGGTGPVNMCKFHGTNLEQFDTAVQFNNGYGNTVDLNYVELRSGASANTTRLLQFDTNAYHNHIKNVGFWYVGGNSVRLVDATATNASQPNHVEKVNVYDDTGSVVTNNIGTQNTVLFDWIVGTGPGNASAVVVEPSTSVRTVLASTGVTGTHTADAGAVGDYRDLTMTGNVTLAAPTNPRNHRVLHFTALASGANRTVTLGAGVLNGSGYTFPAVVTSAKVLRFSLEYIGLLSAWMVTAAEMSP